MVIYKFDIALITKKALNNWRYPNKDDTAHIKQNILQPGSEGIKFSWYIYIILQLRQSQLHDILWLFFKHWT